MEIILITVWLLMGFICVWRTYHGSLKDWHESFNESYWDFHKRNGDSALTILFLFSPIWIMGGGLTLLIAEIFGKQCWWFTTKNK